MDVEVTNTLPVYFHNTPSVNIQYMPAIKIDPDENEVDIGTPFVKLNDPFNWVRIDDMPSHCCD